MHREKYLIKNTGIIFIGRFCTRLITFLLLPLYTSLLTTDEYGTYDLVISYMNLLVPVITLQIGGALFRYLIDVRDDKEGIKQIISNGICILGLGSLVTMVIMVVLQVWCKDFDTILIPMFLFYAVSDVILQIARGLGNNIDYSLASIVVGVSNVLLDVIFLVLLRLQLQGLLISVVIANAMGILFLWYRLKLSRYVSFSAFQTTIDDSCLFGTSIL